MLTAILSLALVAQTAAEADEPAAATPRSVLSGVRACDVEKRDASIRVDQLLQEAVVDIRRATPLSDAQLTCLAHVSVVSRWFLTFDSATDARYQPLYFRASMAAGMKRARAWVAAHGLASRVPHYDAARDDAAATLTRIEALCGVPPGTYRASVLPDVLAPSGRAEVSDEKLICISDVAFVVGVDLGFVGNEAAAPQPPR